MCRALKVMCVAPDDTSLSALKRAVVSAEWELTRGATAEDDALAQLEAERPHALIVFGEFAPLVRRVRAREPFLRIVTDRPVDVETVVAVEGTDLRAAVTGLPRPGGPLR